MAVGGRRRHDQQVPTAARPALTRSPDRLLGGVCAGAAERLGVDPLLVRVVAVLIGLVPLGGVLAYCAAWWYLPLADRPPMPREPRPPWLEALQRDDRRTIIGVACLGVGGLWLVRSFDVFGGDLTILAISLVATGVAVAWVRTAPEERDRLRDVVSRASGTSAAPLPGAPGSLWRLVGGLVLVVAGGLAFIGGSGQLDDLGGVLLAAVVTAGGLGLLIGPWALGILRLAGDERRQRIRSEERAELAAQLHDSVLQTLVLIQRSAATHPADAVALARLQERVLRSWLYSDGPGATAGAVPLTLSAALEVVAAEVEVDHHIEVELVTVGDRPSDDATAALVASTREALVNSAKHAGVGSVDCFAECDAAGCRVFVRDRGAGFDPAAVPDDRRGIAESITARLARVGGKVTVTSAPGAGTEVAMELPA
jgi:signal transduction histidine kinase/phage shock protein PspC (stress-responsive transcriptional regulator)